jgi:hypothetical protein
MGYMIYIYITYRDWLVVWNMLGISPETVGNVIIPTDFHSMIFHRGRRTNHQHKAQFRGTHLVFLGNPGAQSAPGLLKRG